LGVVGKFERLQTAVRQSGGEGRTEFGIVVMQDVLLMSDRARFGIRQIPSNFL
jgi:hypothetical protein